jgi:hypothetical protein
MKRGVLKSSGIVMLLTVGLFAWGAGHPAPAWSGNSCSLKTLEGTYSGFCHGVQGARQNNFAAADLEHFHGDGTSNGFSTFADKHNVLSQVPFTATYTVKPDCTGTYTATDVNGTIHLDIFVAPDGSEFNFVYTDPGVVDAGSERRVGP